MSGLALPCRRNAFTLVELLVVVGIIAVVIAFLMPALTRAREHANRVECAANLRGLGHALTMYTVRYGHYPGCHIQSGPFVSAYAWPVRLRPFLGGDRRTFHCPSRDERSYWSDDAPGPGPRAAGVYVQVGYEKGEPLITLSTHFSYGYNGWGSVAAASGATGLGDVVTPERRGAPFKYLSEVKATRVRFPAEMIAIADSTVDGRYDPFIGPYRSPMVEYYWPGRVHGGGANVLFCDGHVTWYLQRDLILPDPSDPSYPSKARIWNYDHQGHTDTEW